MNEWLRVYKLLSVT